MIVAWFLRDNNELVESSELGVERIKALNDETRLGIIRALGEEPSYPAEISNRLDIPKQKAYYHFRILEESGLIQKKDEVKKSGGLATIYEPSAQALHLDIGGEGRISGITPPEDSTLEFFGSMFGGGEMDGFIVVGSPDEHGPDQVRGRDGHLAGEIGLKLGNYMRGEPPTVRLDTEIVRSDDFRKNMVLIGGILTNTLTRKYNHAFDASFEGESFPYRKLETPDEEYTDARTGVIQRTQHPDFEDKQLVMVAGIQNSGTMAAARAFHDLEQLFEGGESYVVIQGQDLNGDGEIDDYEVVEKG